MKWLNSFTSFTRLERIGIAVLCSIIIVLVSVKATMHYWVPSPQPLSTDARLQAAYQAYERSHANDTPANDATDNKTAKKQNLDYVDKSDKGDTPVPAVININTADSQTLVRLKGIGPAMAHKIIVRRSRKRFATVDELQDVQTIPAATFDILRPHLSTGNK